MQFLHPLTCLWRSIADLWQILGSSVNLLHDPPSSLVHPSQLPYMEPWPISVGYPWMCNWPRFCGVEKDISDISVMVESLSTFYHDISITYCGNKNVSRQTADKGARGMQAFVKLEYFARYNSSKIILILRIFFLKKCLNFKRIFSFCEC